MKTFFIVIISLCYGSSLLGDDSKCEALSIECSSSLPYIKQVSCLKSKKNKLNKCGRGLDDLISTDKQTILSILDNKAVAAQSKLEKELSEVYDVLVQVQEVNRDISLPFSLLSNRVKLAVKDYKDVLLPTLSSFKSRQLEFVSKFRSAQLLSSENRIQKLIDLEIEMHSDYATVRKKVEQARFSISAIRQDFTSFSARYISEIEPYRTFIEQNSLTSTLFSPEDTLELLDKMTIKIENWLSETFAQHKANLLVTDQAIDSATREYSTSRSKKELDNYYRNVASANFLGKVSEQIRLAFVTYANEMSDAGLPLQAKRYEANQEFLEYSKICDISPLPSWMQSGCKNVSAKKKLAIDYMEATRGEIRGNLSLIEEYVDEEARKEIAAIQTALDSKNYQLAAVLYDQVLRGIEL